MNDERRRTGAGAEAQKGRHQAKEAVKAAIVLLAVILTHYGYQWVAAGLDEPEKWASWWFYIFRGVEGALLFYLLSATFAGPSKWIGAAACWLGMWEETQTAVCGAASIYSGPVPLWSGLCLERFGPGIAIILGAIALWTVLRDRQTRP